MKHYALSLILLLLASNALFSQKGTIKGTIIDKSTRENIPFATIALLKSGQDQALTGAVSDENGAFHLEKLPYGSYTMVASFIGYTSFTIPEVKLSSENKNIELGEIELERDAFGIEELEVRAAARTSTGKIDRISYRAEDFETAQGGSALDLLSKLPSVNISSENNISVRGSSDFVVYLNGKPTNTSVSVLLGQIPAENITSIDIITVPTSRFEAQGKGGILNISTKRETRRGLTLMATAMAGGTPWKNGEDVYSNHTLNNNRVNGGINLNYNLERVNFHANLNYTEKNSKGIGDIYSYIYQDESQPNAGNWYILDGRGARPKWDESLYTNFGIDIQTGNNSEFSANYQYSQRHTGRAAHYNYKTYFSENTHGGPVSGSLYELYNPNDIHRKGSFQNLSLDYRLKPTDNSSFTASFLFESSTLDQTIENKEFVYRGEQEYYDYYSDEAGNPVFHSFQSDATPLEAVRLSVNYKTQLGNGNTLELGAGSQNVRLDGDFAYDTVNILTGNFAEYDYFNNRLDLKRDVYAAYIDFSGSTEKLSYILGLRVEYLDQLMTVGSTRYFEEVYSVFEDLARDFEETSFEENKLDLFPSLHLRYKTNAKNSFTFSASRRINRPPAKNMAPFLYRRHQEIFEMGDPLLEPEYSWNADLAYNHSLGVHNLSLTGFVRSATNAIYRVNRLNYNLANVGGVLLRSYTNAGNQLALGAELGTNLFFFNRLKIFAGGSLYQFSVESNENLFGDQSNSSSLNRDAKTNISWQIINALQLTFDYSFRSKSVTPQGEDIEFQMMNIALNFSPEKRKSLSFYAKMLDIMGTNQSGGYTAATEGSTWVFRRDWVYDYEGQIIELGMRFTFNQQSELSRGRIIGDEYF